MATSPIGWLVTIPTPLSLSSSRPRARTKTLGWRACRSAFCDRRPLMRFSRIAATAALLIATGALAQEPPPSSNFPRGVPPTPKGIRDVTVDADGTLHYGPRTGPPNMWVSPEMRATAARIANDTVAALKAAPQDADSQRKALAQHTRERLAYHAQIAMQTYPEVQRAETQMAGVPGVGSEERRGGEEWR